MNKHLKFTFFNSVMNKKIVLSTVLVTAAILASTVIAGTGNGAPSGAHYNLNLIGVKNVDQLPNDANNGHRIFVNLQGNSKIYLSEGEFAVIDADATDGRGEFQLPKNPFTCNLIADPDCENPTFEAYTVWIRPVGKPTGSASMKTCASDMTDLLNPVEVCSTEMVVLLPRHGKSTFTDVTKQLTTIYADINADGKMERVGIFDSRLEDYLWSYDNTGLKIAQLRFYSIAQ